MDQSEVCLAVELLTPDRRHGSPLPCPDQGGAQDALGCSPGGRTLRGAQTAEAVSFFLNFLLLILGALSVILLVPFGPLWFRKLQPHFPSNSTSLSISEQVHNLN